MGKGAVLLEASSPAALARASTGAARVRELVQQACDRAGLEYRESSSIVLRRGPYVIGAGLELPESRKSLELKGRFLDLFQSDLPVVSSVRLEPGRRVLLYDLDRTAQAVPGVVAAACRVLGSSPRGKEGLEFSAVGPDRTECVLRVRLSRPPTVVTVDGTSLPEESRTWDEASRTLRLRFASKADGRKIVLE